jgi:hypothetical protein
MVSRVATAGWHFVWLVLASCGSSESNSGVDSGTNNPDTNVPSSDSGTLDDSGTLGGGDATGTGTMGPEAGSGAKGDGDAAGAGDVVTLPSDAGLPPIDPSVDTSTLTNAQLGELCDWTMAELGGYGKVTTCGGNGGASSVQNPADQAMCIATAFMFRCPVTVGHYETCILAQVPSQGCDFPTTPCAPLVCQG